MQDTTLGLGGLIAESRGVNHCRLCQRDRSIMSWMSPGWALWCSGRSSDLREDLHEVICEMGLSSCLYAALGAQVLAARNVGGQQHLANCNVLVTWKGSSQWPVWDGGIYLCTTASRVPVALTAVIPE